MSLPWIVKQTWQHLLFAHWSAHPAKLKCLLPPELELDTYEGNAWLSAVAFKVRYQRFRGLPELPLLRNYHQLNIRTYVRHRGIPGVYFFTLDANHPPTVIGAKALSLPYRYAKMNMTEVTQTVQFESRRIFEEANFSVQYRPVTPKRAVIPGSLDSWLLERYCLFTKWGSLLLEGNIRHESWEIRKVEAFIDVNSVLPIKGFGEPAILHYADNITTFIYPLKSAR